MRRKRNKKNIWGNDIEKNVQKIGGKRNQKGNRKTDSSENTKEETSTFYERFHHLKTAAISTMTELEVSKRNVLKNEGGLQFWWMWRGIWGQESKVAQGLGR